MQPYTAQCKRRDLALHYWLLAQHNCCWGYLQHHSAWSTPLESVSGSLPTAEQTALPEIAVRSANHAVKNMLEKEPSSVRTTIDNKPARFIIYGTTYNFRITYTTYNVRVQLLPRRIVPWLANTLPRMEWQRRRDTSRSILRLIMQLLQQVYV